MADYLFSKGNEVMGVDNGLHPSSWIPTGEIIVGYGDLRYYQDIETLVQWSDIVINLAAQINVDKSIDHPEETMDINLRGVENILNACRRYKKILIQASTSEVYGGHDEKISEESPTLAQSPYAVAKLAADKLCGNYHDLYGLEVYRLRCFNIFGPRQSSDTYGAVIPIFANCILKGVPPIIFGNGHQRRDYIYIDDVVRMYEMLPTRPDLAGTPINLGTGESVEIIEIARMINKILGKDIPFEFGPDRPGEVKKLEADITLASESYGFKPTVTFEEGLRRYLEWLKKSQ